MCPLVRSSVALVENSRPPSPDFRYVAQFFFAHENYDNVILSADLVIIVGGPSLRVPLGGEAEGEVLAGVAVAAAGDLAPLQVRLFHGWCLGGVLVHPGPASPGHCPVCATLHPSSISGIFVMFCSHAPPQSRAAHRRAYAGHTAHTQTRAHGTGTHTDTTRKTWKYIHYISNKLGEYYMNFALCVQV